MLFWSFVCLVVVNCVISSVCGFFFVWFFFIWRIFENGVDDILVHPVHDHKIAFHVCHCSHGRSSCGLIFRVYGIDVKCGVVHSVRGFTVGPRMFVISVICCSCVRLSGKLFFRWVCRYVVRVRVGIDNGVLFQSVCDHTVGLPVFVVHVVCCSCIRSSRGLFFMLVVLHVCVLHAVVLSGVLAVSYTHLTLPTTAYV